LGIRRVGIGIGIGVREEEEVIKKVMSNKKLKLKLEGGRWKVDEEVGY
jgi:hypothetical protein